MPARLIRRAVFVALALTTLSSLVMAQMPPGGGRGRPPGMEMPRRDPGPRTPPLAPVTDPVAAFERELPSLRMDLKLAAEQVADWDTFARAVRDAAEASRAVARMAASLRVGDDPPPLGKSLDELGRFAAQRASAIADAHRALAAMEAQLSPEQKSMLNRRFRQAVTEPLGP